MYCWWQKMSAVFFHAADHVCNPKWPSDVILQSFWMRSSDWLLLVTLSFLSSFSLLMTAVFLICSKSFAFCSDVYYTVFQIFEAKVFQDEEQSFPGNWLESQMIFIDIDIALHFPSLEITAPLYVIASSSLNAFVSSKVQCWHLKYHHWHGW